MMAFTPVEWIALIMIIAAVIKMLVLLVKPLAWMNFAKGVYSKPAIAQIVGLILGIVILYYLVDAGITIVEILAITAFVAALILVGLAAHIGDLIAKYERQIKAGTIWKENWLYTLIWIILLIWGAGVLFGYI